MKSARRFLRRLPRALPALAISLGLAGCHAAPPTPVPPPASHYVTLAWQESDAVDGFDVYRDGALITISPVEDKSYVDSNVTAGATYSYYVVAIANGITSQPSESVTVTVP